MNKILCCVYRILQKIRLEYNKLFLHKNNSRINNISCVAGHFTKIYEMVTKNTQTEKYVDHTVLSHVGFQPTTLSAIEKGVVTA